ncbi:MAG: non-canonical purine NTP pyrophosphatase [bacterium]|nr:non-canonical purine NTP pyrophosphatase [bacterium]
MKIFISYAHDDTASALAAQQALTIHEVWFDQRLTIGQEWWNEIERQIAASNCVLFLMSPRSLQSEYCNKEIDFALKLGKPIAPVMIQPLDIPEHLSRFQVIHALEGFTQDAMVRLLNGLFEIERQVFNPLKSVRGSGITPSQMLKIGDLYFATTNDRKKTMYEQILNTTLQTAPISLPDVQHVDAGEVALDKARQAYEVLKRPVFVDHSALAIRAWGGLPGGLTTTFLNPAGLHNICKMLQPFEDKYAEAISVIAFTDGHLRRKFVGMVPGEIPDVPRGDGYSWNNIFIPSGFSKTLGEMTEDEILSISSRRRAIVEFMRFLQTNYEVV